MNMANGPDITTTNSLQTFTPNSEIQYLTALFRRIRTGAIRIPTFQRGFVWSSDEILSLLDSVYRGYPIGSLLFWRATNGSLTAESTRNLPRPTEDEKPTTVLYVLDGMQRLSTLFGVFYYNAELFDDRFDVRFNLRSEQFLLPRQSDGEWCIPLNALFVPKEFLAVQARLFEEEDGDELVERSLRLHSQFQEYAVPVVTIDRGDVSDVVSVFQRINSSGIRLSAVDFMRALTWSEDFDLNEALLDISHELDRRGFDPGSDAIVKSLAVALGRQPTAGSLLTLRDCSAAQLSNGIARTRETLNRVVGFFEEYCRAYSSDYIPYEAHWTLLTAAFLDGTPSSEVREYLARWFIMSSVDERLRGRPDNYVARLVDAVRAGTLDEEVQLFVRAYADVFSDRRLIAGRAVSAVALVLFAINGARSLVSGEVYPAQDYMSAFASSWMVPVGGGLVSFKTRSIRVISNLALLRPEEAPKGEVRNLILTANERLPDGSAVLASQFISEDAVELLRDAEDARFVFTRAKMMLRYVESLVDTSNPWPVNKI
jgi:Protein of unknown function DUF262